MVCWLCSLLLHFIKEDILESNATTLAYVDTRRCRLLTAQSIGAEVAVVQVNVHLVAIATQAQLVGFLTLAAHTDAIDVAVVVVRVLVDESQAARVYLREADLLP